MTVTQSVFRAALLDPGLPVPKGLCNTREQPATRRFDVYRNNVAAGLSDALETAFPVIRAIVGDAFFRAMAGVFLRTHPPASPLIMFYGAQMPAFLAGFPPVRHLPYLPDIARIEIALREAYHAADAAPVASETLAVLDPARLDAVRITLAPALRLIVSDYPVHGIWQATARQGAPKPQMRPEAVLVTRPGFDPQIDPLDPGGVAAIRALMAGAPMGAAMAGGGEALDQAALLTLLITRGAIVAIA